MIKDLNISPETLKLLQERAGNTLELIGIDKNFLSRIPVAQQLRERMDKWDFIKLKSFCTKTLCLPYYAYVFSSTKLEIRVEQVLPGNEVGGGGQEEEMTQCVHM
jgi:hypothetical protein